jgi:hypothetical protein
VDAGDLLLTGEAAEMLASEAIRILAEMPGVEPDRVRDDVAAVLARAAERAGEGETVRVGQVIASMWDMAPWARAHFGLRRVERTGGESGGERPSAEERTGHGSGPERPDWLTHRGTLRYLGGHH